MFVNGIFKFTLQCPPKYNDVQTHPKVTFSSYVYSPHVNRDTGVLDISVAYPSWDVSEEYHMLLFIYFFVLHLCDISNSLLANTNIIHKTIAIKAFSCDGVDISKKNILCQRLQ